MLATNTRAQEWTGWRGPNRDGIVQVAGPATWPETLQARWSVPVGEGYANPLFSNGRIFQFARQGNDEVAMAVDPSLVDEAIQQAMDQNPSMAGEVTTDQVRIALFVVLAGFGLWALLAAGLAVLAWVGRSWAWVLLCISAGLSAGLFLAVTVLGAYVAVIALAATAGSLALLIRPEVREWYRR